MADPSFTPPELDQLEDALDDLVGALERDNLSATMRGRLQDYQKVLSLSAQALPLEDPSPDLIESVLARADTPPVDMEEAQSPSMWARLRRQFLLPALALAGSAAVVLLLVRPDLGRLGEDRVVSETAVPTSEAEFVTPPAPGASTAQAPAPAQEEGAARARRLVAPDSELAEESGDREADERAPEEDKAERSRGKKDASSRPAPRPSAEPAEPAAQAPSGASAGDDVTWTAIADADAKRRGGRCGLATIVYRQARQSSDSRIAARGHAGLGLCAERSGQDGETHLARARKLDRTMDAFIRDERARAYRPGAKSSKKRKAAPNVDALDPL